MGRLSVRLNADLDKRLTAEANRRGLSRSETVRRLLDRYLPTVTEELTVQKRLERIRPLLGAIDSGIPDLGTDHSKHLQKVMDAD